jgi:dihydropyrimidinase
VEHQLEDVPAAFKMGITSFKVFLTYAKLKWMTDDYWFSALADVVAQEKGLTMIHSENGLVTDYLEDKMLREKRDPVKNFMQVRPDWLEAEAINRAMMVAHVFGSALYVVHNSAGACLVPLRRAQAQGWKVIGETCPQYLTLNDEITQKFKAQAKMGPPLRLKSDNEALWQGLADGTLSTVASDHAPKAKKIDDDFFAAPYGGPQTESMVTMVYSEGVNKGRITLPRLAQVFSENPAKIFGLYPQKGTISVGSDADVVVFDPAYNWTISSKNQHSGAGFTLYEGRDVMGKPVMSMQRGDMILEDGKIVAKPGRGKFLATDTSHLYK